MKIAYVRVSSEEQNTMRQEVLMQELGVDELYIEKASGKNTDRPQLKKMLAYVRRGDMVQLPARVVWPGRYRGESIKGGNHGDHRRGADLLLEESV